MRLGWCLIHAVIALELIIDTHVNVTFDSLRHTDLTLFFHENFVACNFVTTSIKPKSSSGRLEGTTFETLLTSIRLGIVLKPRDRNYFDKSLFIDTQLNKYDLTVRLNKCDAPIFWSNFDMM